MPSQPDLQGWYALCVRSASHIGQTHFISAPAHMVAVRPYIEAYSLTGDSSILYTYYTSNSQTIRSFKS